MTIRDWFGKRRKPPKRRTGVRGSKPGVTKPEPPQPPQPLQPDDAGKSPAVEPSGGPATAIVAETILVAVRHAGEENRGQAELTDDLGNAQRIVQALVESGVKPKAVTAMRVTEVPLTVSYQWSVEITDQGHDGPGPGSQARAEQPAEQRTEPRSQPAEPSSQSQSVTSPVSDKASVLTRASDLLQEITPEAPFQLRFDRLIWLGLWSASLLILTILLVASLSGGNAREFVIGGQPTPIVSESSGTARPTPPLPTASAGVSAPAPLPACLQGTVNNCRCQDFGTQGDAQKFFNSYPPPNRQTVDPDGDSFYCEWLPRVSPSPRQ